MKVKKRVLFLIHDLGGGGAEKVLVNLVNHMDRKKFDIHVLSLFGGGINERLLERDIKYSYVWRKSFHGNSSILKRISATLLHKKCIRYKYDIEVAYLEDICAKVISGDKATGTRHICWIHTDLHSHEIAARGFASIEESRKAYEGFDRVVCVSETVRKDFLVLYPNVKNALVCYNTLETEKILTLKNEQIDDIRFKPEEINLIAVGKITIMKGFDRLAGILKRLRADNISAHIYALGEGPDQPQIETYLKQENLQDYFTFIGYRENPYKYVAACDLFVCASLAEGFSTAATEALIVGTPVCTVEVSGMKEMLGENDEWGIVTANDDVALYEGIKRMATNQELLAYYKKQAEIRGLMFSTENTVKTVEDLLIEVCE